MRIGLDVMGGDFAPEEPVLGAILVQKEANPNIRLVLVGDKKKVVSILEENNANPSDFDFIDAQDVISMADHPTKAISKKPESSIVKGYIALKNNEIDVFVSAGNTGAMLVGAMFTIKTTPGVIRPSIASLIPYQDKSYGILLDVGANADCKPDVLYQFGVLGSLFLQYVNNVENPRVGLVNIGEEAEKGSLLTQAAHSIMKDASNLNFVGNIEGRDLFSGAADVIVCDGFTGNVVLKLAESFYSMIQGRGIKDEFFEMFNYELYGGCPILGVNAPVVVGHGISKANSFKNMVKLAEDLTHANLSEKFKEQFN